MKCKRLEIVLATLVILLLVGGFVGGWNTTETTAGSNEMLPAEEQGLYPNGRYRGTFHDRGIQQVGIQFHLEDNILYNLSFRVLAWRSENYMVPDDPNNHWLKEDLIAIKEQHEELLKYLEGKHITEVSFLYTPEIAVEDKQGSGEIVDVWTGATLRGNKVLHALRDALNRGVYVPAN